MLLSGSTCLGQCKLGFVKLGQYYPLTVLQRCQLVAQNVRLAEGREALADGSNGPAVGASEGNDLRRDVLANQQDAKAMTVQKFEAWILIAQFRPQAPDAEVAVTNIGIVKQNNGRIRKFPPPLKPVMADRLEGVQ